MANRVVLVVHPNIEVILSNVITMFSTGLTNVGVDVNIVKGEGIAGVDDNARAIVFGANFYNESEMLQLKDRLARISRIQC